MNRLVKQFSEMQKMMKRFGMGAKKGKKGRGGFPGLGGLGGMGGQMPPGFGDELGDLSQLTGGTGPDRR